MRVACLAALHLPIQVERRLNASLAEFPLVIGGRPWDAGAVLDCSSRAAAAGVMSGMRLSQAEKLCPNACFVPAQEEAYRAAHDALVDSVTGFTDRIETAGLGLLQVEVSGLARRFGPDADLVRRMVREAEEASGLDVRVGAGNGKFVAERAAHAARPGTGCVVPPGEERIFLSPLPLTTLPMDIEMVRRLHLLGLRTVGALAALPRLAVVRQFGSRAGLLHDLACGNDARPVQPGSPPLAVSRSRTLDEPLSERAPLLAYAEQMAAEVAERLFARGYQAEGLRLRLEDEQGGEHAAGMPVKPPSADAEKLQRLAGRLLGGLAPVEPVVAISLVVYPMRPFHLGATQLALFARALAPFGLVPGWRRERLREVLRRLRERFGEVIIVVASLLRSPQPRPVQVTTDLAGLPRALVWQERLCEVVAVYEAWRVRTRWWGLPVEREYFRVETADGRVRIVFHDTRASRWLLERRCI